MQYNYSLFGSRLTIPLDEEVANAYNNATQAFLTAQAKHLQVNGVKWTPDQPIVLDWNPVEQIAFDKVGQVINLYGRLFGGFQITEEDVTSDFLIKT